MKRRGLDRGQKAAEALRTYSTEEIRSALTKREIKILLLRGGAAGVEGPMTGPLPPRLGRASELA